MIRGSRTGLFLAIVFAVATFAAAGQDISKLRDEAKAIIETKYPKYVMISRIEEGKQSYYNWRFDEKDRAKGITLTIYHGKSPREAAERMQSAIKLNPVGSGKRRSDIGDEAYFSVSAQGDYARIVFRREHAYVRIAAASLDIAVELAKGVDRAIKRSTKK